ncbi:MAG: hydrogenase formation protein HypD [Melioribacteraceae bacterium]|nr:hydrogenase formation protein HypD [Melioribacteraceae bacterium]
MKYIQEFRDSELVKNLKEKIWEITTQNWSIMEICGGQTHSIMKYNIEELLPEKLRLIHGPGCPVCVTPLEKIDKAINLASREDVIFTTFGDMMRVPGSKDDLLSVKANGGDVRMVYSPLDAVKIAEENPTKDVVFFAVGFETTAPANATSILEVKRRKINNFYLLASHVLVPPAIEALLSDKTGEIDGFLAAGHVCTVMGYNEYSPLVENFKTPIVVTGFEPVDIMQGILMVIKQLEEGRSLLENQYSRVVSENGNLAAKKVISSVFNVVDMKWRGIGLIPNSGFGISEEYSEFDAEKKFDVEDIKVNEPEECIAGMILQGKKKPIECSEFGIRCTPEHPLGAPMVSSEGACAAYFHYR